MHRVRASIGSRYFAGQQRGKDADVKNNYGQLVEEWKVDLILKRATRMGFRRDELEDLQQDIIQAVLNFEFVSQKSNGAKEHTALTALIDNQLAFIQRRETRRRNCEEKYRQIYGAQKVFSNSQDDAVSLSLDLQAAIARLAPVEHAVCSALMQDEAQSVIASNMGATRYKVEQLIECIREQFQELDMDGYL